MASFNLPNPVKPVVADIYHGDRVGGSGPAYDGFVQAKEAGILGIIHKSSQGLNFADRAYSRRRKDAERAGLLWGAYHFNTGDTVKYQVDHFLVSAEPDEKTLLALDFEDNPRSNMTVQQAVEFLKIAEEKLGRKLVIYSGNRLKDSMRKLGKADQEYLAEHKLWLAQYGKRATVPSGFGRYFLWQYTGDGIGAFPHYVPGITVPGGRGIDLNIYAGTTEELETEWAR